jgi:hypothetical protein
MGASDLNSSQGLEKQRIYLGELGVLVSQILIGLKMVDSASLSSTMLFAPSTVCDAFSSLSKAVHSAMKYSERSPNCVLPGKKPDCYDQRHCPKILPEVRIWILTCLRESSFQEQHQ